MYRANSLSQSALFIGGREPVSFQSVILKPDLVRRVKPPTDTMPATNPPQPNNQYATALSPATAAGGAAALGSASERLLRAGGVLIKVVEGGR